MNKRFGFSRRSKWLAALIAGLLVFSVVGVALALVLQIDNFNTGTLAISVNNVSPTTNSAIDTDAAALGGDREAVLTWVSGNGSAQANIDSFDTNRFNFNQDNGVASQVVLRWDGIDSQPTVNNQGLTGLQSDLTGGGTNDSFDVEIVNDDNLAVMTFTVYSTAANWSQYRLNLPGGINFPVHVDISIPFGPGNGWTVGGGSGANFASVTSLEILIDGTVTPGTDVAIDLVDTDNFREYGDLPGAAQGGPVQYPLSIVNAYQAPQGLRLGSNVDIEAASQPAISAGSTPNTGDDRTDIPGEVDDEDGIIVPPTFKWSVAGGGRIRYIVKGCADIDNGCYLNGWIDWGNDGSFSQPGDQIMTNWNDGDTSLTGVPYNFPIPSGTTFSQSFYARFRVCNLSGQCDTPDATNIINGEIEDYRWDFGPLAVTLESLQAQPVATSPVLPVALVGSAAVILIGAVLVTRKSRKQSI